MYLEILTPSKKVFAGDIKLVKVPGSAGSFEIMKNHAPIISTLDEGNVRVVTPDNEIQNFGIKSGVVQVLENKVIILAESLL
ncbi:MAG: ATP synthase F1 subunit epsilon [Bacteroidota bacterium]|nr:ATP synthase F1 subunit epsilon [Bacteroidota bacterium]